VARLLTPVVFSVEGRPAAMGVMTGVARPMNSVTVLLEFSSQRSPEPSAAIKSGPFRTPLPSPIDGVSAVPELLNSLMLLLP
jgi:hypothetical protein